MSNNPLTEKDFEDLYTWSILSRRDEYKQMNPLLCRYSKVQSAKRLLKQRLNHYEMFDKTQKGIILHEIDGCFQIPDTDVSDFTSAKPQQSNDGKEAKE